MDEKIRTIELSEDGVSVLLSNSIKVDTLQRWSVETLAFKGTLRYFEDEALARQYAEWLVKWGQHRKAAEAELKHLDSLMWDAWQGDLDTPLPNLRSV